MKHKGERQSSSYYHRPVVQGGTTHASSRWKTWWCRALRDRSPLRHGYELVYASISFFIKGIWQLTLDGWPSLHYKQPRSRPWYAHEIFILSRFAPTRLISFCEFNGMQIDLFVRIVESCEANSHFFFTCRRNTADLLGLSSIQKISMSMRVIAYDIPTDYTDEYLHSLKCVWLFVKEQTMSRMSPRGGVNRRLKLFLIKGLIIAE